MKQKTLSLLIIIATLPLSVHSTTVQAAPCTGDQPATFSHVSSSMGKHNKHTFDLKNFYGIDNSVNAEIHYTQADHYGVTMTAGSDEAKSITMKVSNGMLVIEKKANRTNANNSYDDTNIVIDITSPRLTAISNTSSLTFSSDSLTTDKFCIDNNGTLQLSPGLVKCVHAKISNQGMLNTDGQILASSASIVNSGVSTLGTRFSVDGDFIMANNGHMTMGGKVTAYSVDMDNSGITTYSVGINADKLNLKVTGIETGDMSYKGGDMNINCLGNLTLKLDADCDNLFSNTNGRLTIDIKGQVTPCANYGAITRVRRL